ncbi:hypothetical protein GS682_04995 [Nostoc sp. B(2019)]|nr:hypothetical protein [Nostoc sp. B(2019)]
MTHPIYTTEQLLAEKLEPIKAIARQLGVTPEGDKRNKDIWIDAIIELQLSQTEKLSGGFRQIDEQVDEQVVAQAEMEAHIAESRASRLGGSADLGKLALSGGCRRSELSKREAQAAVIAPDLQRLEMNQQGYQDAVAGLEVCSTEPCYLMGYDRGVRDISPTVGDSGSQAIVFDKVSDGKWEATVNGVLIRIASVQGGYKTNLTGDAIFVDFGVAIKESLLAVARLQARPEKPALEVFATTRPNVYAVYSHKPGLESKRYEVDLTSESCTCPHYEHRHEQESFKDKHIEAVRTALRIRTTPLLMEEEMLLDQPCDELTIEDWERLKAYNLVPDLELAAA